MTESTSTMMMFTEQDYSDYENDRVHFSCNSADIIHFSRVFIIILYCLVFILGFTGNILVVCVLVKHRKQATLTDVCLFNLALSDLLFIITLPLHTHYTMVKKWTHGGFFCHFSGGAHRTGFFCSIFSIIIMTVDRYVVILHDAKVVKYRTVKTGFTLMAVVWFISLCISLPSFIFTSETELSFGLGCSYIPNNDAWHVYNILSMNILGLGLPLLVMLLSYSRIIPVLMRLKSAKKKRVVKLIISIVIAFFLLWSPYNISLFLRFLDYMGKFPIDCDSVNNLKLSISVTETIAFTHCCLNPIIYAFVGQKFMRRVLVLGKNMSVRRGSSDSRKSTIISRSSDGTFIM